MTIIEIKERLEKENAHTALFSFKDKSKREFNACMYHLKQRNEYVVEVYGLSGQHTVDDFHAKKYEIELKETVGQKEEAKDSDGGVDKDQSSALEAALTEEDEKPKNIIQKVKEVVPPKKSNKKKK